MQLMMFEELLDSNQLSCSGKTSQESYQPRTMPSAAFLESLPEKVVQLSRHGESGQTLVAFMAPREQSRGGFLTPNISEWPNAAAVCSLSQVLEQTLIPQRFFLSSTACAGILRRAEKRGKSLPPSLHEALQAVALEQTLTATAD